MEAHGPVRMEGMPVFDFECAACGKTTEILVRSGGAKPRCASCKSVRLKKAFSAPAIITKGSGATTKVKTSGAGSKGGCSGKSCGSCCGGCH